MRGALRPAHRLVRCREVGLPDRDALLAQQKPVAGRNDDAPHAAPDVRRAQPEDDSRRVTRPTPFATPWSGSMVSATVSSESSVTAS